MKTGSVFLLLFPVFCQTVYVQNEVCKPHPTLVAIDHPRYGYYPYYIKLHRCGGSCEMIQPSIRHCVAKETKKVTIDVFSMTGLGSESSMVAVNDTKCGCECVAKASDCDPQIQVWKEQYCQCQCKYQNMPPKPCPKGHRWSVANCACLCDKAPEVCPYGKYWSQRSCRCICHDETVQMCSTLGKIANEQCECVDQSVDVQGTHNDKPKDDSNSSRLMLILMVAEFGLLFLVFDAILYRKNAGLIYSVTRICTCRGKSGKNAAKCSSDNVTEDTSISNEKTENDYVEPV